jgi:RNA polymerase sigma factor (sigma-70 family)
MDDIELVREYAARKSENAFTTLVERHLPLVYSAALRQVGNPATAEDVSQVVFLLLARKADKLPGKTIVAGWLYRTTRHLAAKALRQESRRRHREQEALAMQNDDPDTGWTQMAPFLDETMAQLGELDRSALLLRYFQNKSLREVGDALGVNDDTAQKRVSRALDKLRNLLLKRGVVISAVAATGLLATRAAQFAPVGLSRSVAAVATGKAAMSSSAYALLLEAGRQTLAPKLAAAGAAALVLAGLGLAGFLIWPKPPPVIPVASLPSSIPTQPVADPSPVEPPSREVPKADPATNLVSVPAPVQASNAPPQVALVPPRPVMARPTNAPVNPPLVASNPRSAKQPLMPADGAQDQGYAGYDILFNAPTSATLTNAEDLAHSQNWLQIQRTQAPLRVKVSRGPAQPKKN